MGRKSAEPLSSKGGNQPCEAELVTGHTSGIPQGFMVKIKLHDIFIHDLNDGMECILSKFVDAIGGSSCYARRTGQLFIGIYSRDGTSSHKQDGAWGIPIRDIEKTKGWPNTGKAARFPSLEISEHQLTRYGASRSVVIVLFRCHSWEICFPQILCHYRFRIHLGLSLIRVFMPGAFHPKQRHPILRMFL